MEMLKEYGDVLGGLIGLAVALGIFAGSCLVVFKFVVSLADKLF